DRELRVRAWDHDKGWPGAEVVGRCLTRAGGWGMLPGDLLHHSRRSPDVSPHESQQAVRRRNWSDAGPARLWVEGYQGERGEDQERYGRAGGDRHPRLADRDGGSRFA